MNSIKRKGSVFVISAPSGCGKTTVVNKVLQGMKGVERSISATTRLPRKEEEEEKDYFFISEKSFKNKVEKGEFLEWVKNFGYYYGTPRKKLLEQVRSGKDVILTIDVRGASQIRKQMPGSVLIFVAPPTFEDLTKRLKKRATDGAKEVSRRLRIAKKEMAYARKYDYVIVNDKVKNAAKSIKAIIMAKRCKTGA